MQFMILKLKLIWSIYEQGAVHMAMVMLELQESWCCFGY